MEGSDPYAGLNRDHVEFRALTQGGQTVEVEAIHEPTGETATASAGDPDDFDGERSRSTHLQAKACRILADKVKR